MERARKIRFALIPILLFSLTGVACLLPAQDALSNTLTESWLAQPQIQADIPATDLRQKFSPKRTDPQFAETPSPIYKIIFSTLVLISLIVLVALIVTSSKRNSQEKWSIHIPEGSRLIIAASMLTIGLIASSYLWSEEALIRRTRQDTFNALQTVLDTSNEAVISWLNGREEEIQLLTSISPLRKATTSLLNTPNQDTEQYRAARNEFHKLLDWLLTGSGYDSFALIGPDGEVITSGYKPTPDADNTQSHDFTGELSEQISKNANSISIPENYIIETLSSTERTMLFLPQNSPDHSLRSILIGTKYVNATGRTDAILYVTINPGNIFSEILSRGQIGATGETYSINRFGQIISQSRFHESLFQAGLTDHPDNSILNIDARDPGTNLIAGNKSALPRHRQPLTLMASKAITGESGHNMTGYNDYRGIPVVGIWRWNDRYSFAIATEMNLDEAYSAFANYRQHAHLTLTVTIALTFLLTLLFKKQTDELKKSEEKFRSYIENAPIAIAITDKDRNNITVNSSAEIITGYSKSELLAMTTKDLADPVANTEVDQFFTTLVTAGKATGELPYIKKDGSRGYWDISSVALPDGRYLSFAIDTTARKSAEEGLLRLKKLESLGMLAGGIAHDFNNLLAVLFGNIEIAKMHLPSDHKSYKHLESAQLSMEYTTSLTNQLLTFAKGGAPIREINFINDLIADTAQFALRGSNVTLQTNIAEDLYAVNADKGQLNQVLNNLLINAQQAMPTGGTVTVNAENLEIAKNKHVQITIQDKGKGIAPGILDKIFDPYFTTKQKGKGLGLASAYSIIKKHNGHITVNSELDVGTTFTIVLPAAEQINQTEPEAQPKESADATFSPARILILDDEEMIREMLGAMLTECGYSPSFAADGQEAISKYKECFETEAPYDLVISDLTLPGGIDGNEVAQEILKVDPLAKIIISSGYSTDPIIANYKDYGFKGIAVKPYRLSALQNTLEQILNA